MTNQNVMLTKEEKKELRAELKAIKADILTKTLSGEKIDKQIIARGSEIIEQVGFQPTTEKKPRVMKKFKVLYWSNYTASSDTLEEARAKAQEMINNYTVVLQKDGAPKTAGIFSFVEKVEA